TCIGPGVASVSNDGSDFDVIELVAEGRHGGSGMAAENRVDLAFHGSQYRRFGAIKRREGGRHALTIGLVARHAVCSVNGFATSDEFFLGPLLGGVVASAGQCFLLVGSPVFVFVVSDDAHDKGHEGVVFAAKLGALAALGAGFWRTEPGIAQEA